MLITKFNAMVRNRWVWAGVAVLTSVAFLGVGLLNRGGCRDASSKLARGIEGNAFGKHVSVRDFYQARYFETGFGRPSRAEEGEDAAERIRHRTWRRLAALQTAARFGITVTDAELQEAIQRDPTFQAGGGFSPDRYRSVVMQELHVEPAMFESYLRQELTMRKVMAALQCAVWTSPYELKSKLERLTDQIAVAYAFVPAAGATNVPPVSDDEARGYFDANRKDFTIPEKASVKVVAFPVSNYLARATVSGDEIKSYYDDHMEDYSVKGTNGLTEARPLAEVGGAISNILQREKAAYEAKDVATEFVMSLAPDRYGRALGFAEAATARGLNIATTALFSATEPVPGISAGTAFNRAAFELDAADAEKGFSDAVLGDTAAYVLAADAKVPSREAQFEEVKEQAHAMALEVKRQEAFDARLEALRKAIDGSINSGQTFAQAAADQKLNVVTTEVFSVYAGIAATNLPYAEELPTHVLDVDKGKLADTFRVTGGAVLACVTERQPGDAATTDLMRPQFLRTLDQYRTAALFKDWTEHNLTRAQVIDYAKDSRGERLPDIPLDNIDF